jgi:hypothetical protein
VAVADKIIVKQRQERMGKNEWSKEDGHQPAMPGLRTAERTDG